MAKWLSLAKDEMVAQCAQSQAGLQELEAKSLQSNSRDSKPC
jgi:hypothetical protein